MTTKQSGDEAMPPRVTVEFGFGGIRNSWITNEEDAGEENIDGIHDGKAAEYCSVAEMEARVAEAWADAARELYWANQEGIALIGLNSLEERFLNYSLNAKALTDTKGKEIPPPRRVPGDDYWHCVGCGKRFLGYGGKCPSCNFQHDVSQASQSGKERKE